VRAENGTEPKAKPQQSRTAKKPAAAGRWWLCNRGRTRRLPTGSCVAERRLGGADARDAPRDGQADRRPDRDQAEATVSTVWGILDGSTGTNASSPSWSNSQPRGRRPGNAIRKMKVTNPLNMLKVVSRGGMSGSSCANSCRTA
jgi:hypothetical protein